MKRVTVSQAKNKLSELLRAVRRGETVLILNRNTPVARLAPAYPSDAEDDHGMASLVRDGAVDPPKKRLDVEDFFAMPRAKLPRGVSAVEALLKDREESM